MAGHWVCILCDDLGPGLVYRGPGNCSYRRELHKPVGLEELFTEKAMSFQQFIESGNMKGSEFENNCRTG